MSTAVYQKEYARRVLGRTGGDLRAVLAHMAVLAESGVSLPRLAEVAGLDYSGLWRLQNGVSAAVTRRVAVASLCVQPTDASDTGTVPFARLEAVAVLLESRGWTRNQMAAAVGSRHFPKPGRSRITVRVLRLYAALLDLPPKVEPDLRAEAQREGWRERQTAHRREQGMAPREPQDDPELHAAWRTAAACLRPGSALTPVFFSELPENIERAKAICRSCPVQADCLRWALSLRERDDGGTIGGYTESERRRLRKAELRKRAPRGQA